MKTNKMVILDTSPQFGKYLHTRFLVKNNLPFEILLFSEEPRFLKYASDLKEEGQQIQVLVLAEHEVSKEELEENSVCQISLLEEQSDKASCGRGIYKYQSAETLWKEILSEYYQRNPEECLFSNNKCEFLGIYSPVKRCLQTTFSFCLAQILAKKGKVLYINFEAYAGFSHYFERKFTGELTDIMYFMNQNPEKLVHKLQEMKESYFGIDFIPPAFSYFDIQSIQAQDWLRFLKIIKEDGGYRYIILDLSDYIQGLFDVLRICKKVYTIQADDGVALAKISQYEEMLTGKNYEDILQKTKKLKFPRFKNLPKSIEQLPYSQLAKLIKEMEERNEI